VHYKTEKTAKNIRNTFAAPGMVDEVLTLWIKKKNKTLLMSITSWNIHRLSQFFHC